MIEFLAFIYWIRTSRTVNHDDEDGSVLWVLLFLLPLICMVLAPYLIWCAFKDRYDSWLAGLGATAITLAGIAWLVLEGSYWQAAGFAMVVGLIGLVGVLWVAYKRERAAGSEDPDESAPRWRFS